MSGIVTENLTVEEVTEEVTGILTPSQYTDSDMHHRDSNIPHETAVDPFHFLQHRTIQCVHLQVFS